MDPNTKDALLDQGYTEKRWADLWQRLHGELVDRATALHEQAAELLEAANKIIEQDPDCARLYIREAGAMNDTVEFLLKRSHRAAHRSREALKKVDSILALVRGEEIVIRH